jgi:hypothetical protein
MFKLPIKMEKNFMANTFKTEKTAKEEFNIQIKLFSKDNLKMM